MGIALIATEKNANRQARDEMKDLYSIKRRKTEVFTYKMRQGAIYSDTSCKPEDEISITFVDEKFKEVSFLLVGIYQRTDWEIMALIADEITNIENGYRDANQPPSEG